MLYTSVDAAKLPTDVDTVAARVARVPRVSAARAHLRALGADRAAAGPVLPFQALRRSLVAGKIGSINMDSIRYISQLRGITLKLANAITLVNVNVLVIE